LTVYAGTFGNRVFKTVDGGQLWAPAYVGFTDDTVLSLALDPIDPSTLYAGTTNSVSAVGTAGFFPGHGVFKTVNRGSAWLAPGGGLPSVVVTAVAIAPSNPSAIYAGTSVAGVFKSTDRGQTWTAANPGLEKSDISDVVVDPLNPNVVYVALEGCSAGCAEQPAGIFKSVDGGATWKSTSSGIVDDLQVLALAIDRTDSRVLYAATRFDGIYKTSNAGGSWTQVNNAATGTLFSIVHFSLVADPGRPGVVYAGTFDGILKTTDGGMHWAPANQGMPPSTRVFALAVH
jgi:photosystem II stability/assembly factor-like uncharacterized protein